LNLDLAVPDMRMEGCDRIVAVSYRLPFRVHRGQAVQNPGGLVTALLSLVSASDHQGGGLPVGDIVWIGKAEDTPEEWAAVKDQVRPFELVPVDLPTGLDNRYYGGFCNDLIWPLFHYFPSLAVFDTDYLEAYRQAQELFAQAVANVIRPTDIIWIHDYQMMLLPAMIRQRFPEAKIGFFLHIPWPSYEVFRLMPRSWRRELIEGMLGADLVGFHTHDYTHYFVRATGRVLGLETWRNTLVLGDRLVHVDTFPIGINYRHLRNALSDPVVERERGRLRRILGRKKLIFSVDRLDYTKGLLERLLGFELFLQRFPYWHKKVVFDMVVVPSRESVSRYQQLRKEIEATVGRINGRYGGLDWRPVVYEYRALSFPELVALYDASDVGLITPLRDGMNLVAKEYIACQGSKAGVLILSEMAGAAAELTDALLVNPTDKAEIASAIATALEMPEDHRRERLGRMQRRIYDYDVFAWAGDYFDTMARTVHQQQVYKVRLADRRIFGVVASQYRKADHRILLMDYDGTLVPFSGFPEQALPDKPLLDCLQDLAADARNTVVIVSGRDRQFLEQWFGSLGLVLVAEHGALIRYPGQGWVVQVHQEADWQPKVMAVLDRYVDRCSGSLIEKKAFSLAWHYRNCELETALDRSQELMEELRQIVQQDKRLQVFEGHKVIEVKIAGYDKGTVAAGLLAARPYDFVLAVGDDRTDEDLFRVMPADAFTFRVGLVSSLARYNLKDQTQVMRLLRSLVGLPEQG